jgi:hypothetical protein
VRKAAFHLEVVPRSGNRYGLALTEIVAPSRREAHEPARHPVVRLWGSPLQTVFDRVADAVRASGGRPSDVRRDRKAPFPLDEETAVRLGLLFLAIKPLKKTSRIEAIRDATEAMSPEEAYYWYAKCANGATGRRAQRAFRILLAQE